MKEKVIRLLFEFFKSYMSPEDAVIATLGGWGLEAGLWQEMRVKKDNGWLIERSLTLRKNLIKDFPFHYVNQLKSFPRLFQSVKGRDTGIDFFHLDLCGTIEPSYDLIYDVLPLVLTSKGKCLAITVADQRRNRTSENFEPVFIEGRKLFGKSANEELLRHLKLESAELATYLQNGIHDEGIARREFGVLVHLAKVLGNTKIERMERYVYHSEVGSNNTPFRMRTYILHLESGLLNPKEWIRNPIQLVLPEKCVFINQYSEMEKKGSKKMTFNQKTYPSLAGMLTHASAEVKADFDKLMLEFEASKEFGNELSELLAKYGFGITRPKRATPINDTKATVLLPGELWGTTDKDVSVKLFLLEAESKGPEALAAARKTAIKYLEIGRQEKKGNIVGSHLARTKGNKFRPFFVKSVLKQVAPEQHDAVLEALAGYYNTLGNTTDTAMLKQEAVQCGYGVTVQ